MLIRMKFKEWIALVGDEEAARILRTKPRTTRSWREGTRYPRPKGARQIVERLKGKVTLAEIYG